MQINQLAGQILLATPSLQDPDFKDAVILVCHHDDDGCMGLIINRPQEISLSDVLTDLGIKGKTSDIVKNRIFSVFLRADLSMTFAALYYMMAGRFMIRPCKLHPNYI